MFAGHNTNLYANHNHNTHDVAYHNTHDIHYTNNNACHWDAELHRAVFRHHLPYGCGWYRLLRSKFKGGGCAWHVPSPRLPAADCTDFDL